jgi:hypothetical protein
MEVTPGGRRYYSVLYYIISVNKIAFIEHYNMLAIFGFPIEAVGGNPDVRSYGRGI